MYFPETDKLRPKTRGGQRTGSGEVGGWFVSAEDSTSSPCSSHPVRPSTTTVSPRPVHFLSSTYTRRRRPGTVVSYSRQDRTWTPSYSTKERGNAGEGKGVHTDTNLR